MNIESLQKIVLAALEDIKALDVTNMDVRTLTDIADVMIVCSGTSKRHVQSIADEVVEQSKAAGNRPLSIEGEEEGEWILVDLGDVIVHVMRPETREFYSLEKLWAAAENARKSAL